MRCLLCIVYHADGRMQVSGGYAPVCAQPTLGKDSYVFKCACICTCSVDMWATVQAAGVAVLHYIILLLQ